MEASEFAVWTYNDATISRAVCSLNTVLLMVLLVLMDTYLIPSLPFVIVSSNDLTLYIAFLLELLYLHNLAHKLVASEYGDVMD